MVALTGKFIPSEKVHADTFKNCHRRFHVPRNNARKRFEHNRNVTDDEHTKRVERMDKNLRKKKEHLKKMGLSYDMPSLLSTKSSGKK